VCFREHVWPKSNWGGDQNPAYSDAHHLHPSDGYDNGRRSNYPLGFASNSSAVYVTNDGSFLGDCLPAPQAPEPPQSLCWEPADNVKGALARTYLYVSTCYWDTFTCCDTDANVNAAMRPWLLATMLNWNAAFKPSSDEQARNDAVFALQGNRNPYVDFPAWADKAYGSGGVVAKAVANGHLRATGSQ
jgi:endonuclease I